MKPRLNEWIAVKIRVVGSTIELYIDNVLATTALAVVEKSQIAIFFGGPAEIKVRAFSVNETRPAVFVVMQFTEEFNTLFREVIKPTCEEFGYRGSR